MIEYIKENWHIWLMVSLGIIGLIIGLLIVLFQVNYCVDELSILLEQDDIGYVDAILYAVICK